jgi:hypothetical protein
MRLALSSTAFGQNEPIPRQYTGDGADISPPLSWTGVPPEARELAILVEDPDAPTPQPWVHWLLYRVPPTTSCVPERIAPALRVPVPPGAMQGRNSWPSTIGYRGPAPPRGHGVHRYIFTLYALDSPLDLEPGIEKPQLLAAMAGHIVAEARLVGTYKR